MVTFLVIVSDAHEFDDINVTSYEPVFKNTTLKVSASRVRESITQSTPSLPETSQLIFGDEQIPKKLFSPIEVLINSYSTSI